jgi:hypothetical protein
MAPEASRLWPRDSRRAKARRKTMRETEKALFGSEAVLEDRERGVR